MNRHTQLERLQPEINLKGGYYAIEHKIKYSTIALKYFAQLRKSALLCVKFGIQIPKQYVRIVVPVRNRQTAKITGFNILGQSPCAQRGNKKLMWEGGPTLTWAVRIYGK